MAFRLVSSAGTVGDSAFLNVAASGTISPNTAVDFIRGSGGAIVGPSGTSSTTTMVFGVGLDYVQGVSDAFTKIIPFTPDQVWEADCANTATTAQVGLRHILSASRGFIHNTASDVTGATGVFLALAMSNAGGSGKLIGKFVSNIVPTGQNSTTYV